MLAAALATGNAKILQRELKILVGKKPVFPMTLRIAALRAFVARSPELRAEVAGSELHRSVVEELDALLGAPPRAAGDWSIDHPLPCVCRDCAELTAFLQSKRTMHDWPLGKDRRKHIHRTLDSCGLPVTHTTLRQGSPQVLRLRKEKSLFSREVAYRQKLEALRKELALGTSKQRRAASRPTRGRSSAG